MGSVLHGIGVTADRDRARLTFREDGGCRLQFDARGSAALASPSSLKLKPKAQPKGGATAAEAGSGEGAARNSVLLYLSDLPAAAARPRDG